MAEEVRSWAPDTQEVPPLGHNKFPPTQGGMLIPVRNTGFHEMRNPGRQPREVSDSLVEGYEQKALYEATDVV